MDGVVTRFCIGLLLAAALTGCGWLGSSDEEKFEEDLPSLDAAVTTTPVSTAEVIKPPDTTETPTATESDVSAGSRFALRRRVDQEISQGEIVSQTTLELDYSVSIVEVVADGGRRFGVRYDRVRYSGLIAGEAFEYDSKSTGVAPNQALPYQGLVDNTFYFRIDQTGQLKLVGFNRFLERCVNGLPQSQRDSVLAQLSVISDADGVSRFVDETVGILGSAANPTTTAELKAGNHWTQLRDLKGDVPTKVFTEFTVESLDQNEAKLQMTGFVSSPEDQPIVTVANRGLPQITVTGGKTTGSCTIDLQTGLPKASRIEQVVEMSVQLPDGVRFDQRKRTISTTERRETESQ